LPLSAPCMESARDPRRPRSARVRKTLLDARVSQTCTHTHTRTRAHTQGFSDVYTHAHVHVHVHVHIHTHEHVHIHTHTCTLTYTHTCTLTYTHVHIHIHKRTHRHTQGHTHTHTRARTHTLHLLCRDVKIPSCSDHECDHQGIVALALLWLTSQPLHEGRSLSVGGLLHRESG